MRLITDEGSIHHSHSFSNRVCVCYCVFGRRGNVQLWTKKTNFPCPLSAVREMKIQHRTIESSYIFRPMSPYFTQAKGVCTRACKKLLTYMHTSTHTYSGRVLNPLSFNPREQTRAVFCGLVWEMERGERWEWRGRKNEGDEGKEKRKEREGRD